MNTTNVGRAVHEFDVEFLERRLWIAVLAQAVEDWRSNNVRRKREAEAFLFNCRKDLESVCSNAGLDAANLCHRLTRMKSVVVAHDPAQPASAANIPAALPPAQMGV